MIAPRVIVCDRCNKPVDRVEEQLLFAGIFKKEKYRIRVKCHGETQIVDISTFELEDARHISFGRAFVQPKQLGV